MYLWERPDWPQFTWQPELLRPRLDAVRLLQGRLLGQSELLPAEADRQARMDALIQNAIRTSEIEGERLNVESVRSSVARHLGLLRAGMADRATPQTNALVGLLLDATENYAQPLTLARLSQWQAALFPEGPGLAGIRVGTLRGETPMQVVSGWIDRPTIHFEAPPRARLEAELQAFLNWFNQAPEKLDPLLRAGIAHLWLITLHPFDDGNGRVTRAVTDMALAQAERQAIRFYSLSAAIMARRTEYYERLETAQKGLLDITDWLVWFLDVLEEGMQQALTRFSRVLAKSRFWQRHAQTQLNERQLKVLNRLLDGAGEAFAHGINTRKYIALTSASKPTATRDLTDLLEKGCLIKLPGGGRSTRYALALDDEMPKGQPGK
jgi:Fic family protein